jgi:hypothetical protein
MTQTGCKNKAGRLHRFESLLLQAYAAALKQAEIRNDFRLLDGV